MTDKLSEKLRNTRAEAFPNTTVGNTTMDIWIDLAENLEQRVEEIEDLARDLWTDIFTGHFTSEAGGAGRQLVSWQELGEALASKLSERMQRIIGLNPDAWPDRIVKEWADEVAALEQEYELVVKEFAILMHEKRQVEQRVERLSKFGHGYTTNTPGPHEITLHFDTHEEMQEWLEALASQEDEA